MFGVLKLKSRKRLGGPMWIGTDFKTDTDHGMHAHGLPSVYIFLSVRLKSIQRFKFVLPKQKHQCRYDMQKESIMAIQYGQRLSGSQARDA